MEKLLNHREAAIRQFPELQGDLDFRSIVIKELKYGPIHQYNWVCKYNEEVSIQERTLKHMRGHLRSTHMFWLTEIKCRFVFFKITESSA